MTSSLAEENVKLGPGKKATRLGAKKAVGQIFVGIILIAAAVIVFLVFYVGPQSQHERERIFGSMNQVSRLIDDRTLAAGQALQTWQGQLKRQGQAADNFAISGFEFGCDRKNIICIATVDERNSAYKAYRASFSLRAIAESAQLPYSEAILLITDSKGNVIAGHDRENKWLQFQSIETLLDTAGATPAADEQGAMAESNRLVRSLQRLGRGEQNQVFEGYPARLSRDIGGQSYAVFVASHQLGKSLKDGSLGAFTSTVNSGQVDQTAAAERMDDAERADQLFFAYVIPERVIDRAALGIPSQWAVNILIILIVAILCIPFLKLLNRSPLKPIRTLDIVSVLFSTMLLVLTAALFVSAVLLRNSVVQDVDSELSRLSRQVAGSVIDGLALKNFDKFQPGSAELAPLESAFIMGESGKCSGSSAALNCGEGVHFSSPIIENIDVLDRGYYRAWRDQIKVGDYNYTQFLKNKQTGSLSWARFVDRPGELSEKFRSASYDKGFSPAGAGRTGLLVSWFPIALRAPILPRNFSFAIVLNTDLPESLRGPGSERFGDVLYHSEQRHSLMENMIHEARDDPRLTAALRVLREPQETIAGESYQQSNERVGRDRGESAGVVSDRIPISYHGRSYFARVRPISNTPWSVVALYERSEALAIFAEAIAHTFFLSCVWILLCLGACWSTPRLLRLTLDRGPVRTPREIPVLGRSIWFFPNGLFKFTPDGFSYYFKIRGDEMILLLFTVGVQAASLVFMPPILAVLAVCGISLMALVGHYLLIAQPYDQSPSALFRRLAVASAAALFASVLFFVLLEGWTNWWFILGAVTLIACFVCLNLGLIWRVSPQVIHRLESPNARRWLLSLARISRRMRRIGGQSTAKAMRRDFVNRAIALLLVLVWVPSVAILNLHYTEYLKGYVGASLISVAESIGEQRRKLHALPALRADLLVGSSVHSAQANDSAHGERVVSLLSLARFDSNHPGWFLESSCQNPPACNFVISVDRRGSQASGELAQSERGNYRDGWKRIFLSYAGNLMPHVVSSNLVIQDSTQMLERRQDFAEEPQLAGAQAFEPVVTLLGRGTSELVLKAGPMEPYPFHPDFWSLVFACFFVALFYFALFQLIRRAATILTGLYLNRTEPVVGEMARLNKLIDEDHGPLKAWEAVASNEQRLLLLTLANSRALNFRDRSDIQALVEKGYLGLTPFPHIANEKLADYLKHDLPHEQRAEVLQLAQAEDDNWEHMRLPVLVIVGIGCALLAYSSPGAVQLVVSGFLALTALLPLTRDPITRVLELQKS